VGLSKARKYISQDMRCLYRDSKQGTPRYDSGVLPLAHPSRVTDLQEVRRFRAGFEHSIGVLQRCKTDRSGEVHLSYRQVATLPPAAMTLSGATANGLRVSEEAVIAPKLKCTPS
jgi:hypothetical protein